QNSLIGQQNMFTAVFDPSASGSASRLYAIYIGGTHFDEAFGVAAAPDGTVWIAGGTFSPDIWIQGNAYQGHYGGGGGDGYIAHINPNLGANSLVYASFFGGNGIDEITSLVLDHSGNLVLSGYTLSENFPVSSNAFQTKYGGDTDAFVSVLNTAKKQLVYSTYFGGTEPDASMDVKEDANGVLYLTGYTESAGLPSTSGALQPEYDGSVDAFALKLDPSKDGAAGIDYFTYLGSEGTQVGYGVDFDSSGDMYVTGYSSSTILAHYGTARPNNIGVWDAFVIGFAVGSPTPAIQSGFGHSEHHRHLPFRVSPRR
ncbi:MAG TPA: SBBP repeat-containing protein, partial [Bryobacteraceae bacterium]|nr:SBBP repeat-containing protein [Bryobacteraceae bacterium]